MLTPLGLLRHGILSFAADGTLLAIEQSDQIDAQSRVEFFDGLLMPGLVNAHTHLELSHLLGQIERGGGFARFADAMVRVRHLGTPLQRVEAAQFRDHKMAADGVVAAGDVCNGSTTFALKGESSIRYHNFIEAFGLGGVDFERLGGLEQEATAAALRASVTPHSTYSVQDADFCRLCRTSTRLSIHFMESHGEAELYDGGGALARRNQREGRTIDFAHYGSPTRRVMMSVPQTTPLLLIHNTFVDQQQVEQLQEHFGEQLTWVVCPRSNRFIEGTLPPIELLRRAGCRIAVGTDSLASNDSLSLIDEIASFPNVPLSERLGWITHAGAEALGVASWAGDFVVGKRPGGVLLTGVDWTTMTLRQDAATRRLL